MSSRATAPPRPAVLFIRSLPLSRDSRSQKMIADYERRGFEVLKLVWTRGETPTQGDGAVFAFAGRGRYGAKFGNLLNVLRWHLFLVTTMVRLRGRFGIVHTVDFDTGIVSVPLGRLLGKTIVYDAFDQFASMFRPHGLLSGLFAALERGAVRAADIAIFPDPARLDQYGLPGLAQGVVIANIPEDQALEEDRGAAPGGAGPLVLTYIGSLEAERRGLEYIFRLCAELGDRVAFLVGGLGQMAARFAAEAARLDNLTYVGPRPYDEALRLLRGGDLLYGPYLLSFAPHRYAAPNKMYEHLLLGRPLLTNAGTPPGRFVEENATGFLFDGSYEGLRDLVSGLTREACRERGARARRLWLSTYRTLRRRQADAFFTALAPRLRPARTGAGGA